MISSGRPSAWASMDASVRAMRGMPFFTGTTKLTPELMPHGVTEGRRHGVLTCGTETTEPAGSASMTRS